MNKERYNQIIDEVYENYKTENQKLADVIGHGFHGGRLTQDEFINKCKTDSEFSETWGLDIEERELNLDERAKLHPNPENFYDIYGTFSIGDSIENSNFPDKDWLHEQFNNSGISTKLITLTYNNETIESYE